MYVTFELPHGPRYPNSTLPSSFSFLVLHLELDYNLVLHVMFNCKFRSKYKKARPQTNPVYSPIKAAVCQV